MKYVRTYQDNLNSSFLFKRCFANLVERGIDVKDLLLSNVFVYEFDYDEWPANHTLDTECIRPYNENMFLVMRHYNIVFPEEEFECTDDAIDKLKNEYSLEKFKRPYFELSEGANDPYDVRVTKQH
jgi:hypothetical protein